MCKIEARHLFIEMFMAGYMSDGKDKKHLRVIKVCIMQCNTASLVSMCGNMQGIYCAELCW